MHAASWRSTQPGRPWVSDHRQMQGPVSFASQSCPKVVAVVSLRTHQSDQSFEADILPGTLNYRTRKSLSEDPFPA